MNKKVINKDNLYPDDLGDSWNDISEDSSSNQDITVTGGPWNDFASQFSHIQDVNNILWEDIQQVGNSIQVAAVMNLIRVTTLDKNTVAIMDNAFKILFVFRFENGSWQQIGNSFQLDNTAGNHHNIEALNTTDIIIHSLSTDSLRVFRFENDSNWIQVGNIYLLEDNTTFGELAALDNNTFCLADDTSSKLRAFNFDGENIIPIGTPYIFTDMVFGLFAVRLTRFNSSEVVIGRTIITDNTYFIFEVYRFSGGVFNLIGIPYQDLGATFFPGPLERLNRSDIIFENLRDNIIRILRFENNSWVLQSVTQNIPTHSNWGSVAVLDNINFAHIADSINYLSKYQLTYTNKF